MSEKTRACLLDLDGTLVDTHDANTAAYADAISEVLPDVQVDRGELRRHIAAGESCTDFLPALIDDLGAEQLSRIAAAKSRAYPRHLGLSRLNDELVAWVKRWRGEPGRIAVLVTTAKRKNAEAVLTHHGIAGLFDLCVFGDGIERLKPDPEIYLVAMGEAGVSPDECVAFEDSDAGVAAAEAAGVPVRVVRW